MSTKGPIRSNTSGGNLPEMRLQIRKRPPNAQEAGTVLAGELNHKFPSPTSLCLAVLISVRVSRVLGGRFRSFLSLPSPALPCCGDSSKRKFALWRPALIGGRTDPELSQQGHISGFLGSSTSISLAPGARGIPLEEGSLAVSLCPFATRATLLPLSSQYVP